MCDDVLERGEGGQGVEHGGKELVGAALKCHVGHVTCVWHMTNNERSVKRNTLRDDMTCSCTPAPALLCP